MPLLIDQLKCPDNFLFESALVELIDILVRVYPEQIFFGYLFINFRDMPSIDLRTQYFMRF